MTESLLSVFHRNNNTHSPSSSRKHPLIILSAIITVSYPATPLPCTIYIFLLFISIVCSLRLFAFMKNVCWFFLHIFFLRLPGFDGNIYKKCDRKKKSKNIIRFTWIVFGCMVSMILLWWTYVPFYFEYQINDLITKAILVIQTEQYVM